MPTIIALLKRLKIAVQIRNLSKVRSLVRRIHIELDKEYGGHTLDTIRSADGVKILHRVDKLLAEFRNRNPLTRRTNRKRSRKIKGTVYSKRSIAFLGRPITGASPPTISSKSIAHSEVSKPKKKTGRIYPVWFGTNRKPKFLKNDFTGQRGNRLLMGKVEVHIPRAHRFGETGSSFWKKLQRFDFRDDTLRIEDVQLKDRASFFSELRNIMRMAQETSNTAHSLFFIHGYNVTFEEAAIRAAQIGFDLKVTGATAFFSWPSKGSVRSYAVDEATIEASEQMITDFLVDFTQNCGADKVHIIAHSMGNRGLLRALQRIAINAETQTNIKFGQILLAAPDIDRELFLNLAYLYPLLSERTTLYASDGDLAVHLSDILHGAPRAGYFLPYTTVQGIDTVAVPNFNVDLLGHAYYAKAEALLHDIYDLILHSSEPAQRQRIEPMEDDGVRFWSIRR